MKIHKNDTVKIISGKDKRKTGKVLSVFPKENKILVEGLNLFKKHIRPKREGQKGEIILAPKPFNASNAMIICPACQKPTRISHQFEDDKKKENFSKEKTRICRKCKSRI